MADTKTDDTKATKAKKADHADLIARIDEHLPAVRKGDWETAALLREARDALVGA